MKKLLTMILVLCLVLSLAACGNAPTEEKEEAVDTKIEQTDKKDDVAAEKEEEKKPAEEKKEEKEEKKEEAEDKKEEAKEDADEENGEKPAESKPASSQSTTYFPGVSKPSADKAEESKPAESKPAESKPAESKPAESKPAESKPAESKPAESAKTVGNTLLSEFKSKAASASSMLSLADALIANDMIPFMGGAMEVEPGLLAGFGNTEITGFKSGATFMPMMGSIAFVGYVFELEDGANVSNFIATLKSNADLRWNVCVEAEEMVTGSVGNKVFFVMCPKQFEE